MEELTRKIQKLTVGLFLGWSTISCEDQQPSYFLESSVVESKMDKCVEIKLIKKSWQRYEGCNAYPEQSYRLDIFNCDGTVQATIHLGGYLQNGTKIKTEKGNFIVNNGVMGYEKDTKK